MQLRYFILDEFDSPDQPGSGEEMKAATLRKLDNARHIAGVPFQINSGYRSISHNKRVGGTENSSHLRGYAVDIRATSSNRRFLIVQACIEAGFTRLGISSSFIHVDDDPAKAQNVIWTY
tara:strand:- start:143 stop:502 length:360 start_codon:yes stop_codon:yes gene_type:complete